MTDIYICNQILYLRHILLQRYVLHILDKEQQLRLGRYDVLFPEK